MLIGVIALLTACTNDANLLEKEVLSGENLNYRIPIEEALEYGDIQYNRVFGETTRASQRKVKSIETFLSSEITRGNEGCNGFYIVNYENDNGFAILAADRRLNPIYAISDEGSLHIADTASNDGLKWYVENVLDRSVGLAPGGTLPDTPMPLDSTLFSRPNEVLANPMLPANLSKFSQSSPYNKYCYTSTGEQALTGCAAIVVGTVIGRSRLVDNIDGYTFNWDAMYQDAFHDGWSQLFERVGRKNYLNMQYGTELSYSYSDNLIPTLAKFGRTNCKRINFDCQLSANLLKDYTLLMVTGTNIYDYIENHMWIIDGGYIDNSGPIALYPNAPVKYMFHCVWGWGGNNNGYFLYNASLDHIGNQPSTYSSLELVY